MYVNVYSVFLCQRPKWETFTSLFITDDRLSEKTKTLLQQNNKLEEKLGEWSMNIGFMLTGRNSEWLLLNKVCKEQKIIIKWQNFIKHFYKSYHSHQNEKKTKLLFIFTDNLRFLPIYHVSSTDHFCSTGEDLFILNHDVREVRNRFADLCVCVHVCTHIHIYIYTHIHTVFKS